MSSPAWENRYDERNTRTNVGSDFNQSGAGRDHRVHFPTNPANRSDFSETGSRSLVAHNQRMGDRASWLDYVRCFSAFGTELCGFIRDAESADAWKFGARGTGHTLDLRDWRNWGGSVHNRSNAAALSAVQPGYTSRDLRHEPVGATSICSAAYQPRPGSQQRNMEAGAAHSTLDRWFTVVWLFIFRGLLRYLCVSLGTGRIWPRRQHRLAPAIRISHVHAMGRNLRLASDQVQP